MSAMRLVGVLVVACGCSSVPYGTYFMADGRTQKIDFDHAEFFFGTELQMPGAFASPRGGRTVGDVYARQFTDTDAKVPSRGQLATYYIPPGGEDAVGDYVVAVARDAQNQIVGVGEARGWPASDPKQVLEVEIPLDNDIAEVWGQQPTCLAWDRKHGEPPVGFVRDDDRDCDGLAALADCNDFSYCPAGDPTCTNAPMLCTQPCAIGCGVAGGMCAPTYCLPPTVCTITCSGPATTPADRLACAAKTSGVGHLEVELPVDMITNKPCVHSFTVALPPGHTCTNPTILWQEMLDAFAFSVSPSTSGCKFDIAIPSNNPPFLGDHHLLVAIDGATLGSRDTFFFGVQQQPVAMCTSMVTTLNTLTINSCQ